MKQSLWILMMLLPNLAMSQDYSKYYEEFEAFKRQAIQEYNDFRDRANAEYAQYMRDAWEWFRGEKAMPIPEIKVPTIPPVVMPEEERGKKPEDNPLPFEEIIPTPVPSPKPKPVSPIRESPKSSESWINLTFYGTQCKVRYDVNNKPILKNTNENSVADMWSHMAGNCSNLLHDCLSIRENMILSDWTYVKLTESIASKIYTGNLSNEAVLTQAFILNQSGFKIHIARSKDGKLHMLIAADCDMYGFPYWNLDGEHYYLIDKSDTQSLYIFTKSFPDEQPMRMALVQENKFENKLSPNRTLQSKRYPELNVDVHTNENLITFYDDYPATYANNDPLTKWRFYALAPLSKLAKTYLYPKLKNIIKGKSETQVANILLNFVQTAFVYEYDDKVWGYDRAFFADETIYYPYCDCEDRAILFSWLIRDLIGLDVVLVYYPGHLATAVQFNDNISGDYLAVNGKRYLVCDPTYIGAPIGMTMPNMDNGTAKVILLK